MSKEVHILWTNDNPLTSHYMVMMYATNGLLQHWWDKVTVIIWGATAKFVAEDEKIQSRMKIAQQAGVHFTACKACAVELGVMEQLRNIDGLDIEIIYWGEPLTRLIQEKKDLITI